MTDEIPLIPPNLGKRKSDHPVKVFISLIVCLIVMGFLIIDYIYDKEIQIFITCEEETLSFPYLKNYEEYYGSFAREFYINRCNEQRKRLKVLDSVRDATLPPPPVPVKDVCTNVTEKIDCFPRGIASESGCNSRGCCFLEAHDPYTPSCFYPQEFRSYKFNYIKQVNNGIFTNLTAVFSSPYVNDEVDVSLIIYQLSSEQILIQCALGEKNDIYYGIKPSEQVSNPTYRIEIDKEKTGFKILRNSTNEIILNSQDIGGLIISEQFTQISFEVCRSGNLFGIGERRGPLKLDINWSTISLLTHDSPPTDKINGYGFHPTYLCLENGQFSHAVTSLDLHAMDIVLQPGPILTYRSIGKGFGFLVTVSDGPMATMQSHRLTLGSPALPPRWALGFHLSRFGYRNVSHMKDIWKKTRNAGIPFDAQWADIDYMDNRNDFTIDPIAFKDLDKFVTELHQANMSFVPILDPGIGVSRELDAYVKGLQQDIFILNENGTAPYIGKVWNPNGTVFVDFTHPRSLPYWNNQIKLLHDKLKFDGLWIDMNEPSNFLDGSTCRPSRLESPQYVPEVDHNRLAYKTVCMGAHQFIDYHYTLHNVYGHLEAVATSMALNSLDGRRPFIISRSTFTMTSKFAGHWTGDVSSTWDDMKQSVTDLLSFSLFGQPMVGADICGFNGNTTVKLCSRWSQLGAFYPFSRNHNSDDSIAQDPVSLGGDVLNSAKKALKIRYSLIPYMYTQFWKAYSSAVPLIRPMFFEYPMDNTTYNIEDQFMFGPSLLVSPVLYEDLTYKKTYFGSGTWIDWYSGKSFQGKSTFLLVDAPKLNIPLFIKGGSIIPMHRPEMTTHASSFYPFSLRIALDGKAGFAEGELFWDDGWSTNNLFNVIKFNSTKNSVFGWPDIWNFKTTMFLEKVQIAEVEPVKNVTLDGKVPCHFNYTTQIKELVIFNLTISLNQIFSLTWS